MRTVFGIALAMLGWGLMAPGAVASQPLALVIAESAYTNEAPLACHQPALALSSHLRAQGYEVTESVDAPASVLRGVIDTFAARQGQAAEAVIYVCGTVVPLDTRLFLLPVDADVRRPADVLTQAVLLKAFMNAMSGSDGILSGDLHLGHDLGTAPGWDELAKQAQDKAHVALTLSREKMMGSVAASIADAKTNLHGDWNGFAMALQARVAADGGAESLFVSPLPIKPPDVPMPAPVEATVDSHLDMIAAKPANAETQPKPAKIDDVPVAFAASTPPSAGHNAPIIRVRPTQVERQVERHPTNQGPKIIRIKVALMSHGLYVGPINDVEDARMQTGIKSFQRSLGEPVTGSLTPPEIALLMNSR